MIRTLDVLFSLIGIIVLSPVILIISLIILITAGWPVVFVQTRIGKDSKPFYFYKFRSMRMNSSNVKPVLDNLESILLEELRAKRSSYKTTSKGDARITPFGKFIRKFSLDELPQLWNILKGEMSLVGSRPDPPIQRADYEPEEWINRHRERPGLTGFAQVYGRSDSNMSDRVRYEAMWIANPSVKNYFKILFLTLSRITKGAN